MEQFELEKPPAGTDGSDLVPHQDSVSHRVYRCDARDASPRLGDQVLERLCREIRQKPCRLPLAAHRCGHLVNRGQLPFQRTWDALFGAAIEAGAGEDWARRCMYAGLASSNVSDLPTPELWALVNRGIE